MAFATTASISGATPGTTEASDGGATDDMAAPSASDRPKGARPATNSNRSTPTL